MVHPTKYKIKKGHFTDVGMTLEELIDFGILEPVQTRKVYRWKHSNLQLTKCYDYNDYLWNIRDEHPLYIDFDTFQECLAAGLIIESEEVVESEPEPASIELIDKHVYRVKRIKASKDLNINQEYIGKYIDSGNVIKIDQYYYDIPCFQVLEDLTESEATNG